MDQDADPARRAPILLNLIAASPVAHLLLAETGQVRWANEAATALLGRSAVQAGTVLADALALSVHPGVAEPQLCPAIGRWIQLHVSCLDDGALLVVVTDAQALAEARIARERADALLDLVREVGRLGTWQRNARTLEGTWDDEMFRIYGLPPSAGTPGFGDVESLIALEDRGATRQTVERSRQQLGVFDQRYRLTRPDGSERQVHSQWRSLPGADGRPEQILGVVFDDTESLRLARAQSEQASELALAEELIGLARWRHDLRTQRMHYSPQAYAVLGMEPRPEGLSIEQVRDLIHPDDLAGVMASAQQTLATGKPTDFDARYRDTRGRWREVLTRRALLRDDSGQPLAFIGVSMDISARVAAARQTQDLAARLRMAATAAGIGYWSLEPGATQPHWNEQMRRLHGLGAHDQPPKFSEWLARFVVEADREVALQGLARLRSSGQQQESAEIRIIGADGQERILLASSQNERTPNGTASFGIAIDITDRRKADLALRQASERAALAARGAGIATWDFDLRTQKSVWDEQMWRLRGLSPRDEPPEFEAYLLMVHEDDRDAARRRHLVAASGLQMSFEYRVVWPDGRIRWLASRSMPMRDAAGEVVRRIGINWDVTEVRQAESARRERELAEQASLAKGEFLSRMSHELRTPLNAVLGFAQLLVGETGVRDAVHRSQLQHILGAGQHLLALINDVLDLTGLEAGQLSVRSEAVDLGQLLRQVIPLVAPLSRSFELPEIELGPIEGTALADPTRLRQVMLNLLSNAIKYNRPGGKVRVEVETVSGQVTISVIDTGNGLTPDQLLHLFEPFNRLGNESLGVEGSGIGLTITKALVEYMGGRLDVQSTPGQGSRFTVGLPAVQSTPEEPTAPKIELAPGTRSVARSSGQVLYVEDNAVNMLLVQKMLERLGDVTMHCATDGASGLAAAQASQLDLVLLDMQLPDMTGMEVFQRLRANPATAHLRCVAVSANANADDKQRALAAGFTAYWTKPLEMQSFLASMHELLGPTGDADGPDPASRS